MDDNHDGRPMGSAFSPDTRGLQEGGNDDPESGGQQELEPGQPEDMQSLMDAEEAGGFRSLRRGQTATGVVVSIREDAVLVDVGLKSEGVIPRQELFESDEEEPDLHIGQEILVHVIQPDSPEGPILSLRRARRERAWADMEHLTTSGGTIEAPVVDHNRGGALLDVRGLRGFVPLSQLTSLAPAAQPTGEGDDTQERLAALHGQRLKVKVLEANQSQNRLILSERAADQEARAERREELLRDLEPGQIRHGRVRNVTNFGAFVDLGGADGLVHVSEISYDRVYDPRTILTPGQEVDVFVLEVRPHDQKIALSLKRAMTDPWVTLSTRHEPGETVRATITRLAKFGAFAQVEPGIEGLIHVTELAEATPRDPSQVVQEGQTVDVKIIHIDPGRRRLGLSLRQVHAAAAEPEMTPEDWAQEQDRDAAPQPSAFGALAAIADTLPDQPEPAESESPSEETPVESIGEAEAEEQQNVVALAEVEEELLVEEALIAEQVLEIEEARDVVAEAVAEGAISTAEADALDEELAVDEVVALEEVAEVEEAIAVTEILAVEEVALEVAQEEEPAAESGTALSEPAQAEHDVSESAESHSDAENETEAIAVSEASPPEVAPPSPEAQEEMQAEAVSEGPESASILAEEESASSGQSFDQSNSIEEPEAEGHRPELDADESQTALSNGEAASRLDSTAVLTETPETTVSEHEGLEAGDERPAAESSNHTGEDKPAEARDRVHDAV